MKLFNIAVLGSLLALAACSSSENQDAAAKPADDASTAGTTTGALTDPSGGSITINTSTAPVLDSLPDVEYTGPTSSSTGGSASGEESDRLPTDSGAASLGESGTGGGTTGGSTDGGFGTTGEGTTGGAGEFAADGGDMFADGPAAEPDGSTTTGGDDSPTSLPPLGEDSVQPEQFRAGSLTAADYNDQLNPHLYQSYASEFLQREGGRLDVPYLDLSKRIGLHVTDEQGRPYGEVKLTITGDNNDIISLLTPSTGITYLYRNIDALPEQFTIRAQGVWGAAIDKTISLEQVQSNRIDIVVPESAVNPAANQAAPVLDIMFVIDTTGSMGDELGYLQTELTSIINALPYNNSDINLGLTFYRDIGDEYVVRAHGFNNDIASVERTLNNETHNGGGDYPEAMDQALHQAIDANWQAGSRRVLFLIADAPPHSNKMRATWTAAEQARTKNIHIVPVAASGVGDDAEYLMRSMAAFTNSRYVFLTDDSGYGNSHAEPKVDCYVVTQLNNLMIRVLNSLIAGERQEPTDNEIIRRVGNYNEGICDQQ